MGLRSLQNFPQIPHTKKPGMMVYAVRCQRNQDRELTVMLLAIKASAGLQAHSVPMAPSALLTTPYLKLLQPKGFVASLPPASLPYITYHSNTNSVAPLLLLPGPPSWPSLFSFPLAPTAFVAQFSLLSMFTLLLSSPTLDCSRCSWLYSPSYLQ